MHLGNTISSGTLGASSISLADKMVEVEQEAAPGFRPESELVGVPGFLPQGRDFPRARETGRQEGGRPGRSTTLPGLGSVRPPNFV